MKVGVAIDCYKLPVFEKRLKELRIEYTVGKGVTSDTLLLKVETNNITALGRIMRSINEEAKS